jgi:hypothetical protein
MSDAPELEAEGARLIQWLIHQARRFLAAGVELMTSESEGITENS